MESEDLVARVIETEERSKSNTKRIDRLETNVEAIHELAQSVAVMAESVKTVKRDVEEIKTDVQALKAIPGKRWEAVVDKIIFGVIAAALVSLVGIAISKLF